MSNMLDGNIDISIAFNSSNYKNIFIQAATDKDYQNELCKDTISRNSEFCIDKSYPIKGKNKKIDHAHVRIKLDNDSYFFTRLDLYNNRYVKYEGNGYRLILTIN